MTLPSKHLLSEVLGVEILDCKVVGNGIAYNAKDNYPTQSINIHELAHKCKEWASKHGVNIWSWLNNVEIRDSHKCFVKSFIGDTEAEAIFKACEWILEKIKC